MILVVSSTNRPDSYTSRVSEIYYKLLNDLGASTSLINLQDLPPTFYSHAVYKDKPAEVKDLIDKYFIPAEKFIFIVPEYNGSFPGILKLLIDSLDVKKCFHGKKAGIVGISSGRLGNTRGIDHLRAIMNHIKVQVMNNQPKLSGIETSFSAEDVLIDSYLNKISEHAEKMMRF